MINKVLSALLYLNTILLSLIFMISAICKLSPILNPDMYYMLDEKFRTSICPSISSYLRANGFENIAIDSILFKKRIGYVEVVSVIILWVSKTASIFGGFVLAIVMAGAIFTHYLINEDPSFPFIVGVMSLFNSLLSWLLLPHSVSPTLRNKKMNKND